MIVLTGTSACGGFAFGPLCFCQKTEYRVEHRMTDDTQAEVRRFEAAREQAAAELAQLYEEASEQVGEENALLFRVHQLMLEDPDYCESITRMIRDERVCAEYAAAETAKQLEEKFAAMEDEYIRGRAADVKDVSDRVLSILTGRRGGGIASGGPVIVAAEDLAPSETVRLDRSKVLAFVTAAGSASSHTAILARTMGIPAVVAAGGGLHASLSGKEAIVDGFTGEIFVEPDEQTRARLRRKARQAKESLPLLERVRGRPALSRSGRRIRLYANIGSLPDLDAAVRNDAEGIGLFRSEFLCLERDAYPSEEEQFEAYRQVVLRMAGKRVVVRTFDIGADKRAASFGLSVEPNPAMGMRAIRISLKCPALFKTQLRALFRASAFGKLAILFPMITSVQEVRQARRLAAVVRDELTAEGTVFAPDVELGVMIETPAAAVISDRLAGEADFFSIGTNDLTQYTLAVDRENESVAAVCDPHHEAVLRLIEYTVKSAREAGIRAGICGELGADPSMTESLLRMGIDELSVPPSAILPLRAEICGL